MRSLWINVTEAELRELLAVFATRYAADPSSLNERMVLAVAGELRSAGWDSERAAAAAAPVEEAAE